MKTALILSIPVLLMASLHAHAEGPSNLRPLEGSCMFQAAEDHSIYSYVSLPHDIVSFHDHGGAITVVEKGRVLMTQEASQLNSPNRQAARARANLAQARCRQAMDAAGRDAPL